jgi:L-threonylcarbamoyladenylate synthase
VEIRVAEETEFGRVVDLIHRSWASRVDHRSSGHRFTETSLRHQIADGAVVLAAVEDGWVWGSATVLPANDVAEIAKVVVDPSAYGSGLGDSLMRAAHETASTMGFTNTLLAVSVYQPELIRWYARFGYVVSADRLYGHASPLSPPPIVMLRPSNPHREDPVGEAAKAILSGKLVGFPTETVYGLAADATNPIAVRSVFAAKGRPVDHPLIVHIASKRSLGHWTVHSDDAHRLADTFWPGPLTMVLPRQTHVLDEVTGGRDTVAVRVPRHPLALGLLALLGPTGGVVAPSANPFGGVSPTTADHVRADGLAHLVLDGGPTEIGVESTIVELVGDYVQILRPGAITAQQIEEVLGRPVNPVPTGPTRAPGMMDSHYAPKAGVTVIETDDQITRRGPDVGYLGPGSPAGLILLNAPNPFSADAVATVLYARLREADDRGLELLYVMTPPIGDLHAAVADRLKRAAHNP